MKGKHSIESVPIATNFASEPVLVLAELARAYNLRWLLAYADDGVIWGELRSDGRLHLSGDAFSRISPPLRTMTLQQTRLFGQDAELLVWKDNGAWRVRVIQDGKGETGEYYDETHLLWGDKVEQQQDEDGFVLLCEGKEGLRHAAPLYQPISLPMRLRVRHYFAYDQDGQAYISHSRLLGIVN